ncbi:MAG: hypothetical protein WBG43_08920 [Marinifilaceae bacterium]
MKKYNIRSLIFIVFALSVLFSCSKEKSVTDLRLKKISVSTGDLLPTFNADCYTYSLNISTATKFTLESETFGSDVKVSITGKNSKEEDLIVSNLEISSFTEGVNIVKLIITSVDKKIKTYQIKVTSDKAPDIVIVKEEGLKEMQVSVGTLQPLFSKSIFNYSVDIQKLRTLDIITSSINENSTINLSGKNAENDDLVIKQNNVSNITVGINILKIRINSEDKSTKDYTLTIIADEKIKPPVVSLPASENLVAYINFNGLVKDDTKLQEIASSDISFGTDRKGQENMAGSFNGIGQMLEISANTGLFTKDITVSYWMKIQDLLNGTRFHFGLGGYKACLLEMGSFKHEGLDIGLIKFVTNHKNEGSNVSVNGVAWSEYKGERDANGRDIVYEMKEPVVGKFANKWVQLTLTYNSETSVKTFYIDGTKVCELNIAYSDDDNPEWKLTDLQIDTQDGLVANFAIGAPNSKLSTKQDSWTLFSDYKNRTFKGLMDDFRIYNIALTEEQVVQLHKYDNQK